ncbi:class I SAM-dependent methyltransferase [Flavisolibacter ginsenosidimutans]|uniref:Class I SAM-dependent methyltransferase n=1 Tax=Flavisolibacter ginsenosidimutans TaxID=661481 RepID=A0A5B8UPM9_9BACT|nr:class I SAM-dependent methyltransferase [Flavisolibacter ginsenosidimutans]QEC58322.1 class I SAM-dependent methyltransferase [Flavisolibacter ginsenosidimutans]
MLSFSGRANFLKQFKAININDTGIKGYPLVYAEHLLDHLDYYASIYEQMFALAVKAAQKPPASLTVLDFGCGNGFLGMFAKIYGFKKVWLCDRSAEFLVASEKTAAAAGIDINGFIEGDAEAVNRYFAQTGERPDIILASDVIEHIYDLDEFFRHLHSLNPSLISVFTTASNPFNVIKTRSLHKMQYRDEWIGYADLTKEECEQKGCSPLSFLEQRKQIIRQNFPQLTEQAVSALAQETRGKELKEIISSVQDYVDSGTMPVPPVDPYWVCDPYTGSWTERILPLQVYRKTFRQHGYSLSCFNGFYNPFSSKLIKKVAIAYVNGLIKRTNKIGRYIAPYIVLVGVPAKSIKS